MFLYYVIMLSSKREKCFEMREMKSLNPLESPSPLLSRSRQFLRSLQDTFPLPAFSHGGMSQSITPAWSWHAFTAFSSVREHLEMVCRQCTKERVYLLPSLSLHHSLSLSFRPLPYSFLLYQMTPTVVSNWILQSEIYRNGKEISWKLRFNNERETLGNYFALMFQVPFRILFNFNINMYI